MKAAPVCVCAMGAKERESMCVREDRMKGYAKERRNKLRERERERKEIAEKDL